MNDARSRAEAAIRAFESAGERHLHVFALVDLGLVAAAQDDPRSAFGFYSDALQMGSESGSADVIGSSLDAMALLLLDLGNLDVAVRLGAASERIRNEVGGTGSGDMAGLELPLDRAVARRLRLRRGRVGDRLRARRRLAAISRRSDPAGDVLGQIFESSLERREVVEAREPERDHPDLTEPGHRRPDRANRHRRGDLVGRDRRR